MIVEVASVVLFDELGSRVRGATLAGRLLKHTNLPFLAFWGLATVVLAKLRCPRQIPWRRPSRALSSSRARSLLLISVVVLLVALYAPALARASTSPLGPPPLLRLFEIVVVGPVVEESLFRGLLFREADAEFAQVEPGWRVIVTVVTTSTLFATWHFPFGDTGFVPHALFGFAMALLRIASGSLLPCAVAHAAGNFVTAIAFEAR